MTRSSTSGVMLAEIRANMARRQVGRRQLAAELGIGRQALANRLRGTVAFRALEVAAIARFLDVPISTLYGDADSDEQPAGDITAATG